VLVLAEHPESTAALHAQVTALEDRLGLTPRSLRMLLWQIVEESPPQSALPTQRPRRRKVRAVD
jgi:hypothetical protein